MHDAYLLAIARRRIPSTLRSRIDPEDAVQEALLSGVKAGRCERGWLASAVCCRIVDESRRSCRECRLPIADISREADPLELLILSEAWHALAVRTRHLLLHTGGNCQRRRARMEAIRRFKEEVQCA